MSSPTEARPHHREDCPSITIRFAGDSGDGMQLTGTQFTNISAAFGNDISTFPDFPAEIRAPAGTLAGVSGFQINFGRETVRTPGDVVNTLVVMNPAALKANIADVEPGGIVLVNSDAFDRGNLAKVGYDRNPLEDGSLKPYRLHQVPMTKLTHEAAEGTGLSHKAVGRCKNFFALGLVCWLYERPLDNTLRWIEQKFGKSPAVADANTRALKAGYHFGETTEMFPATYHVGRATIAPGTYRKVTGNEAVAMGMISAAKLANKPLFYGSYPITPASDILQELSQRRNFGVKTFQAEDEIAGICAAIGASFGGALAATGTSGPGLALKGEAIGLAVMIELPLVIVNVQRGGPSTGLPTKTEQADLLQSLYGRHGECPVPVIAAATPSDCFWMAIEAFRIAVRYMTPVLLLTDGYLANGSEPWRIPDVATLEPLEVHHPANGNGEPFQPYARDGRLARPWAIPGTEGLEHRVGGLEKEDITGNVCYDPDNHQHMVRLRAAKVAGIAKDIPPTKVDGPESGDLLVVGWGGTCGAIASAVERARQKDLRVASLHLRYLNPLPGDLGDILRRYQKVLVPELNEGQLRSVLRDHYLLDVEGFNKVQGKPFMIREIEQAIYDTMSEANR